VSTVRAMEQATALEPHRWTREEYDRMVQVGLLGEHSPVELLEGLIVEMSPEGTQHSAVIRELMALLAPVAAARRLLVGQPLAATETSEPQPDLAIVGPPDFEAHPSTAVLTIEVVGTQYAAARVKLGIYAAAGVGHYWIVDVPRRQVEVFIGPGPHGYAECRTLRGDDTLTVPEFGMATTVASLLPWDG
jgi:Uma2 family endonuclease